MGLVDPFHPVLTNVVATTLRCHVGPDWSLTIRPFYRRITLMSSSLVTTFRQLFHANQRVNTPAAPQVPK